MPRYRILYNGDTFAVQRRWLGLWWFEREYDDPEGGRSAIRQFVTQRHAQGYITAEQERHGRRWRPLRD